MSIFGSVISWLTDPANWSGSMGIPHLLAQHMEYVLLSILIGAVIAIPLGAFIGHTGKGGFLVAGVANGLRALPELGLLILFSLLIGLGILPVVLALVVLAIPPLLAGTYAGIRNVDSSVVDAARGVGMRGSTVLFRVELPIALPLIFGGLRTAMLQLIATATIAAYVGLGSVGFYVFEGEAGHNFTIMAGGAVLIAALALIMEGLLILIQRFVVSPGLRPVRQRGATRSSTVTSSTMDVETAGGTAQ
ncbi:MAG TPA: ABC transporter permease [Pseudonocardiaceae bacterium]|jgi:osmoprotectant transport system permease protein|nr:ABC transporter permease [Pseudonocardiaceae bacterium]